MNELDNIIDKEKAEAPQEEQYSYSKFAEKEKYPVKRSDVLFAIFAFVLSLFLVSAFFFC